MNDLIWVFLVLQTHGWRLVPAETQDECQQHRQVVVEQGLYPADHISACYQMPRQRWVESHREPSRHEYPLGYAHGGYWYGR